MLCPPAAGTAGTAGTAPGETEPDGQQHWSVSPPVCVVHTALTSPLHHSAFPSVTLDSLSSD